MFLRVDSSPLLLRNESSFSMKSASLLNLFFAARLKGWAGKNVLKKGEEELDSCKAMQVRTIWRSQADREPRSNCSWPLTATRLHLEVANMAPLARGRIHNALL